MSMTELEARCVRRAINAARKASEIDFEAITRAVLAEAGVAELVRDCKALLGSHKYGDGVGWQRAAEAARSTLAKIGANQ